MLEVLAVHGVGVLGKDNYFHRICANKIRPNWKADEAEAKAKAKEYEAKVKAEQERAQREAEEARIKAHQQEEKARRKKEREEFLNRLFVAIGTIIGYGLSGWLLGKSPPFWLWIILGCNGLMSIAHIVSRKQHKKLEDDNVWNIYVQISGITVARGQWLNNHDWAWSLFAYFAGCSSILLYELYTQDSDGKLLYSNQFFTFLVGSVSCCLGLGLSWLISSIF